MKVRNIQSLRSGRAVPNQFEIKHDGHTWFQSYRTLIAKLGGPQPVLDPQWDCSKTTARYCAQFLGRTTKEIRQEIKDGFYLVRDLNEGGTA